jgi:hypothetical protein
LVGGSFVKTFGILLARSRGGERTPAVASVASVASAAAAVPYYSTTNQTRCLSLSCDDAIIIVDCIRRPSSAFSSPTPLHFAPSHPPPLALLPLDMIYRRGMTVTTMMMPRGSPVTIVVVVVVVVGIPPPSLRRSSHRLVIYRPSQHSRGTTTNALPPIEEASTASTTSAAAGEDDIDHGIEEGEIEDEGPT